MLKSLCSKQGVLHSLAILTGFHGRPAQCLQSPWPHQQNTNGPYPSELTRFMLPRMETAFSSPVRTYSTVLMEKLIANSPEVIHRVMQSSQKGCRDYLRHLGNRKLVFILDNSGSMCSRTDDNSCLRALNLFGEYGDVPITRQHEMTFVFLCMLHVLVNCGVPNIEVRFLNPVLVGNEGTSTLAVNLGAPRDIQRVYSALACEPSGMTPLTSNLYESVNEAPGDMPTHYLVFTDGCPYTTLYEYGKYKNSVRGLRALLEEYFSGGFSWFGRKELTINFIACTNSEDEIAYLNDLDSLSDKIDVTDDLYSEMEQVVATKGRGASQEIFSPTISAFIYKALVGCLDRAADRQDERA